MRSPFDSPIEMLAWRSRPYGQGCNWRQEWCHSLQCQERCISRWNSLIRPAQREFRKQRALRILRAFPQVVGGSVVDIGGTLAFWREVQHILRPAHVKIYNLDEDRLKFGQVHSDGNVELHVYDGLKVPLEDKFADLVICNSVIEHVPMDLRQSLASEVQRVGQAYIAQTPSPHFPFELHFGLPFVHWLPRPMARPIVKLSPFALLSDVDVQRYFDETRLLSKSELQGYFPGAIIETERFMGIAKSYLAMGSMEPAHAG